MPVTEEIRVIGLPIRPGTILIQCSACGVIGEIPAHLAPLRMLAHYHHHETEVP